MNCFSFDQFRSRFLFAVALGGSVFLIMVVFFINSKPVYALPGIPLPTFETVSTVDQTVVIPDDLIAAWRGNFSVSTTSVVVRPPTLREYLESTINLSIKPSSVNKRAFRFNPAAVYTWTGSFAGQLKAEAQEPELKMENGEVVSFTPPQTGIALDRFHSTLAIIDALQDKKKSAQLAVSITEPKKDLASTNDLGITELVGRGESKFNGSPKNRRHNISVGVSKMKGVLIAPGEEFSFNKHLGPVEASEGFLPELVIKKTGTVPELGGGLCQVSSTTFRAAMNAGLPITQRRNHSYAVQYYAPQGTDATIYPGVIDLKFTNDTGHTIMIWPYFKTPDYLVFDFYGTYDGRTVTLDKPVAYDRKTDGSLKAYWIRHVTKNGVTTDSTFNSVYQSPALFNKQEEFVPATPPPGTAIPAPEPEPDPLVPPSTATPPTST
jgi:vancomycin resistance protein YoaR